MGNHKYKCTEGFAGGQEHKCPLMEYAPDRGGWDAEVYECPKCGYSYRLYYEDMA